MREQDIYPIKTKRKSMSRYDKKKDILEYYLDKSQLITEKGSFIILLSDSNHGRE